MSERVQRVFRDPPAYKTASSVSPLLAQLVFAGYPRLTAYAQQVSATLSGPRKGHGRAGTSTRGVRWRGPD